MFRRQDQFIQSCFLQYKSRGNRFTFSEFYEREKAKNLNWFTIANYYADLFGRDHLEIRLYDPKQFADKNLLQLFGEMIGAESMKHTKSHYSENVGFSSQAVDVFEKISLFLTNDEKKTLKSALQKKFNKGRSTEYDFLDSEEISYIYNYFLESNQNLADQYCNGKSFSGLDYSLAEPKNHQKYKIYLHVFSELMNKESGLTSTKKAILKSYLSSTRSSLLRNI